MSKFLDQVGLKTLWELISEHYTKREDNYAPTYVPYKGQICFIDTLDKGLRVKVGDGETTFANLPFSLEKNLVESGYYNSQYDVFFRENAEINMIPKDIEKLYYDMRTDQTFYVKDDEYKTLIGNAQVDSGKSGLVKLYAANGLNIDGTMTQKAITEAIDAIDLELVDGVEECFTLVKPW